MKHSFFNKRHPAAPVTPGQVTAIKMGQKALGISREDYLATLWDRYRADSCKDLTFEQANDLIEDYKSRGFEIVSSGKKRQKQTYPQRPPRGDRTEKVVALATRDEIDKVNALAALISWRTEDGLELFLEKRMRIKGGRVRTAQEAYLAIEGLKKMFVNHMRKLHGDAWWVMTFSDPAVMEFIRTHKPAEWR